MIKFLTEPTFSQIEGALIGMVAIDVSNGYYLRGFISALAVCTINELLKRFTTK